MATATYTGPVDQSCLALVDHGYGAVPEPGATYELPAELVEELVRSSAHWTAGTAVGPLAGLPAREAAARAASLTLEELDGAAVGEKRKTVLAALEKRRQELAETGGEG